MDKGSTQASQQDEVRVVRARVDSLSLYEITDSELKILERGSPSSIYLNFSIFLISIGCSFLISLITTEIDSIKIYTTFVVFSFGGIIGGLILLCLWRRERCAIKEVIKDINNRIPSSEIRKVEE